MAERTPREVESREKAQRPVVQWTPPTLLPDPIPEPGYEFGWIRLSTLGQDDPMNISSKLREGWEPVRASDHPEVQIAAHGKSHTPDCIEVGGLMLCKIPKEMADQRRAYYQTQSDNQMTAVDNNLMRENDPRMPLFKDRKSKVVFGREN